MPFQDAVASIEIDWFVTDTIGEDGRPVWTGEKIFSCSDKIYTMTLVSGLTEALHTLVVDWIDPSGRRREHTVHEFRYWGGRQWMWAWLTLHPPRGAIALRLFNPSIGMREFIGTWTVKVIIDDQLLGQAKFEVLC
jgi:hypothetical protein